MKELFLISTKLLVFGSVNAQKVFIENVASKADIKVYIEIVETNADLIVYQESMASKA